MQHNDPTLSEFGHLEITESRLSLLLLGLCSLLTDLGQPLDQVTLAAYAHRMLITPKSNRGNKSLAIILAGLTSIVLGVGCIWNPLLALGLPVAAVVYWLVRRRTLRRLKVMQTVFPPEWERGLISHVEFYRALDADQKDRFRNLVKVFLDETPITGVRTDVDELSRVLVAASAIIPIFGFDDWEYSGLGEILLYPSAFSENYQTDGGADNRTLGMIGVNYLSGVMILSKPDLLSGFSNPQDKRNVGIHEFAHLVDKADGSVDGIPAGMPREVVEPWIKLVAEELRGSAPGRDHIDAYGYTNEAEYFAVLSEYFFESPEALQKRDPKIYEMMQSMYRQNTRSMFKSMTKRPRRFGRNSKCPCGSGQKFKRCCRLSSRRGTPDR